MFLGALPNRGSHIRLLFEQLLENEPTNNMYFCLKTLKLHNKPSVKYKIILSRQVQVFKQPIRLN